MGIPEAHRDPIPSRGFALLWIGQGAIGEEEMKGVAIGPGYHGHGFTQTAEEAGLAVK